jgi:FKBP-type peptidyl-prolyl cis-trans isomerase (trigger factor)
MTYEAFLTYIGTTDAAVYESAKEYVDEDLVYYAILQAENITLTDADLERLDSYIQRYKEEYGYTDEQVEANLESIKSNMLYDKVQELLISWADIRWE